MVNEFKLTVVNSTPKPNADLCMHMDLPLDKKLIDRNLYLKIIAKKAFCSLVIHALKEKIKW